MSTQTKPHKKPAASAFAKKLLTILQIMLLGLSLACTMQVRAGDVTPESSREVSLLDIERLSKSEIMAAVSIQGIANRKAPSVFLRQTNRFWHVAFSFYQVYKDRISPDVLEKYPSSDFFWVDYYSKKWGYKFHEVKNVDELLLRHTDVIKGAVRIGANDPNAEAVAATIAGLQDLVIVNDEVANRWPELANLPVVVDLRERFPANAPPEKIKEGLEWAIREFLPQTSTKEMIAYSPDEFGFLIFDLGISKQMFTYNLLHVDVDAKDRESLKILAKDWTPSGLSHNEEYRLLDLIYEHLEPYGMVWGWDARSELTIARRVAKKGGAATCSMANNLSFHAGVPARNAMMARQRELNPEDVELEDKYYITFVSAAGDAVHTHVGLACNGRWLYSDRGSVPMNWTVSPYIVKTMPGMMEMFYEQATPNDYFVNETSGYGYNHPLAIPDEYLMGYADKVKTTSVLSDTHYSGLWWYVGIPEARLREWMKATGMKGFFPWQGDQQVIYTEGGPTVIQSERFFKDHHHKETLQETKKTPQALAESLKQQLKDVPPPWFTVIYDMDPNFAAETMAALPADKFKAVLMDEFFIAAEKAKDKVQGRKVEPVANVPGH